MQTTILIRSDEMPGVIDGLASEIIARHPSGEHLVLLGICLLYTSDAADER